jgi:hypothetical protein
VRKLVLRLAEADQGWITAWRQALPADEMAVADRFRDPFDRLAAMAAKALLRVCLGAATGQPPAMIALDRDALGRPFMPQAPLLRLVDGSGRGRGGHHRALLSQYLWVCIAAAIETFSQCVAQWILMSQ